MDEVVSPHWRRWIWMNRDRATGTSVYLYEASAEAGQEWCERACSNAGDAIGWEIGRVCENICLCRLWKKAFNSKMSIIGLATPILTLSVIHIFEIISQNIWKTTDELWSTGLGNTSSEIKLIFRFFSFRIVLLKHVHFVGRHRLGVLWTVFWMCRGALSGNSIEHSFDAFEL